MCRAGCRAPWRSAGSLLGRLAARKGSGRAGTCCTLAGPGLGDRWSRRRERVLRASQSCRGERTGRLAAGNAFASPSRRGRSRCERENLVETFID